MLISVHFKETKICKSQPRKRFGHKNEMASLCKRKICVSQWLATISSRVISLKMTSFIVMNINEKYYIPLKMQTVLILVERGRENITWKFRGKKKDQKVVCYTEKLSTRWDNGQSDGWTVLGAQ